MHGRDAGAPGAKLRARTPDTAGAVRRFGDIDLVAIRTEVKIEHEAVGYERDIRPLFRERTSARCHGRSIWRPTTICTRTHTRSSRGSRNTTTRQPKVAVSNMDG